VNRAVNITGGGATGQYRAGHRDVDLNVGVVGEFTDQRER
jgi:hypothetical protein